MENNKSTRTCEGSVAGELNQALGELERLMGDRFEGRVSGYRLEICEEKAPTIDSRDAYIPGRYQCKAKELVFDNGWKLGISFIYEYPFPPEIKQADFKLPTTYNEACEYMKNLQRIAGPINDWRWEPESGHLGKLIVSLKARQLEWLDINADQKFMRAGEELVWDDPDNFLARPAAISEW